MDVLTLYQTLSPAGEIKSKGNGEYCGPCPTCGGGIASSCGLNILAGPQVGGFCVAAVAYRGTLLSFCGHSGA